MKNSKVIPGLKGRQFNGNPTLRIKLIRQEPRHKIRQLLRSFIPLVLFKRTAEEPKIQT